MTKKLILILGPTAVGKSDYGIGLAKKFSSPIISCDSRQIYREMKIGTAPPSEEQLSTVKHYFIFSHSVTDLYTAGRYEVEALALVERLFLEHNTLIMVGGSGLYADAFCYGLDDFPQTDQNLRATLTKRMEEEGIESLRRELKMLDIESYNTIDIANKQRVLRALEVNIMTGRKFSSFKSNTKKTRPFDIERICLMRGRDELYDRINRRVDIMIDNGLVEEVISLERFRNLPALRTVGYREIFDYIDGKISLDVAKELIKRNTRRYAKRQITYWRGEQIITLN